MLRFDPETKITADFQNYREQIGFSMLVIDSEEKLTKNKAGCTHSPTKKTDFFISAPKPIRSAF